MSRFGVMRSLPLLVAAVVLAVAPGMPVSADSRTDYVAVIQRARTQVSQAQAGNRAAAAQAASTLRAGTSAVQPEVLADLDANPPRLADAAHRLDSLLDALGRPVATPDGAKADRELHSILAEPRYQPNGPNLLQVIEEWLLRQLSAILFPRGSAASIVGLLELAFAAIVVLIVLVIIGRAVLSRRGGSSAGHVEREVAARAAHSFAEADRLAASGDYLEALKALTSAVATTVGGVGTWEVSPFTVRELFSEKRILDPLQPLVVPFEAAAYGHRQPDAATYERAVLAATPYRGEKRA